MPALEYVHVDVFSSVAYSGNSLPVFLNTSGLSSRQMLRITQELRHFEAVFLEPPIAPNRVRARVFDLPDKTVSVATAPSVRQNSVTELELGTCPPLCAAPGSTTAPLILRDASRGIKRLT